MYLIPELYTLKTIRTINFKLCVLYHNNKRLKKKSEDRTQTAKDSTGTVKRRQEKRGLFHNV